MAIEVEEVIKVITNTSSQPALCRTECGRIYVKAMNTWGTPHVLVCEMVATRMANWLDMPTLWWGIVEMTDEAPIDYLDGSSSLSGPAFATLEVGGRAWAGHVSDLEDNLQNTEDIAKLVTLDTWTLNTDRYAKVFDGINRPQRQRHNTGNVFFCDCAKKGKYRLVAMDQGHCFSGGRELSMNLAHISQIKDDRVYGMFDEFIPFIDEKKIVKLAEKLRKLSHDECKSFVEGVPQEWLGHSSTFQISVLVDFIFHRAMYLADSLVGNVTSKTVGIGSLPGLH